MECCDSGAHMLPLERVGSRVYGGGGRLLGRREMMNAGSRWTKKGDKAGSTCSDLETDPGAREARHLSEEVEGSAQGLSSLVKGGRRGTGCRSLGCQISKLWVGGGKPRPLSFHPSPVPETGLKRSERQGCLPSVCLNLLYL